MKKNKFFALAASFLAFSFGLVGCDSGDGEDSYNEETPTTVKSYAATSVYDGAVWDFSGFTGSEDSWTDNTTITNTEQAITGEIAASTTGTDGTKLEATSLKGKAGYNKNLSAGYLQASKATATLADVSKGYYLTLTLGTASDIYLKGTGAGAAEQQRYIAIADANDIPLVYKDNLASGKTYDFQIQAAPAGEYKIYINGSCIVKLDLSNAHTYTPAVQISALKITTAQAAIPEFEPYETLSLNVVDTADESTSLNADAIWTSSNTNVATVKEGVVTGVGAGTAIIRARIGRFYDQRTVTVNASTKTRVTMFSDSNRPSDNVEIGVDWASDADKKAAVEKATKATTIGGFVTISDEAFAFTDTAKAMDWTDKESPILGELDTSVTSYKGGVIFWKNEQSTAWTADTAFATVSFKAKPTGSKATLKEITFTTPSANSNASHYAVTAKVGDGTETALVNCAKGTATISVDQEITAETTITVTLYVVGKDNTTISGKSGKAKSFGFNELAAVFTE